MELKDMDFSDIWKELSKFAPEDWYVKECHQSVSIQYEGEKHRTWRMYARISKTNLGDAEIEFTCIYNYDEETMFQKFHTVDNFKDLINYVNKIFKLGPDTIDSISDEMVKTFKNSFDRLLK